MKSLYCVECGEYLMAGSGSLIDCSCGWKQPEDKGIDVAEYEALQSECEKLRKDAERSRAAFRAVIEYMLGDGRREDPLEFLGYWTEGEFESVKEGWPEAPVAIYYADPLADHDAINAAMKETNP